MERPACSTAVAILAIVAAGCAPTGPVGRDEGPAPEIPGPVLVAEIVNQSAREVVFSYEFEAADGSSTGGGEGLVTPCTATTESWSEITGAYSLSLDGELLVQDRLAPRQGDGAYLHVRIRVGRAGIPEVLHPRLVAASPPLGSRELAGC